MTIRNLILSLCTGIILAMWTTAPMAAEARDGTSLSERIEALKQSTLELNRDLTLLEQELFYPSSQSSFFLSVDVGTPIRLVDVNLTLDGEHLGYHFYSDDEFDALTKGGIHRLYTGNLRSGRHVMDVTITGYDPRGRDYQRTASYSFTKGPGRKMIELRVLDNLDTMQHRFEFREWDK